MGIKVCLALCAFAAASLVAVLSAAQLPRGQSPDRGRPTRVDDEVPLFDFDAYFLGKWTFDWEVPDGPLGPAGTLKGTIVYRHLDGPFYEAETAATGPGGAFEVKELIAYHKEGKTAARLVADSRGFSYMQLARVGGDLGGYYTFHYTSAPFTYGGKTIRIRNIMRLLSPVQYRNVTTVSVDGAPFLNYGSPWVRKEVHGH